MQTYTCTCTHTHTHTPDRRTSARSAWWDSRIGFQTLLVNLIPHVLRKVNHVTPVVQKPPTRTQHGARNGSEVFVDSLVCTSTGIWVLVYLVLQLTVGSASQNLSLCVSVCVRWGMCAHCTLVPFRSERKKIASIFHPWWTTLGWVNVGMPRDMDGWMVSPLNVDGSCHHCFYIHVLQMLEYLSNPEPESSRLYKNLSSWWEASNLEWVELPPSALRTRLPTSTHPKLTTGFIDWENLPRKAEAKPGRKMGSSLETKHILLEMNIICSK